MSQQPRAKSDPALAKPPEAKPPCQRDREIYLAVRICHRKQTPVAEQFGMSQGRVSQIVKEVAKYMSGFFPGEDLDVRLGEMPVRQLVDWECYQRRVENHRRAERAWEQSQQKLVTEQLTYGGKNAEENLEKTVITKREQRISLDAVKVMERINDKLERSAGSGGGLGGRGGGPRGTERRSDGGKERRGEAEAGTLEKLPPPECLTPEDREQWPKLMREEQELAAKRLSLWPKISLDAARVPPGPLWSYYPWRTEAEHNAALLASMVIKGHETIEEYYQNLEILELSKPFAHPNLLRKDKEGRWQYIEPKQVPLPVMPPERAALPEESPERLYWPYKSKAEHYAMMRAEMVLRGHLSRDQYEGLNAWASWYMNEKYPDPLARIDRNINPAPHKAPTSGRGVGRGEDDLPGSRDGEVSAHENGTLTNGQGFDGPAVAPAEPKREGEAPAEPLPLSRPIATSAADENGTLTNGQGFDGQGFDGQGFEESTESTKAPTSGRGVGPGEDDLPGSRDGEVSAHENGTLTNGQGFKDGQGFESPTRIERRLASGRRMSPVERRRLEGLAARRGAG